MLVIIDLGVPLFVMTSEPCTVISERGVAYCGTAHLRFCRNDALSAGVEMSS
jgi:hypothetical protein